MYVYTNKYIQYIYIYIYTHTYNTFPQVRGAKQELHTKSYCLDNHTKQYKYSNKVETPTYKDLGSDTYTECPWESEYRIPRLHFPTSPRRFLETFDSYARNKTSFL